MIRLAEQRPESGPTPSLEETLAEAMARPTPSWFPPSPGASVDDLAERYRQRAEDRQRAAPRHDPVRPAPARAAAARDEALSQAVRAALPRRRGPGFGSYAVAGFVAVLLGGITGYGFAHSAQVSAAVQAVLARLSPAGGETVALASAALPSPQSHKLITTATLRVADTSGRRNDAIPLMLEAEPPAGGEDIVLKLAGLPQQAYLTAGTRIGPGDWQLDPAEAAAVKLVVPTLDQKSFDLSVAAIGKTSGELAAPIKEMTVALTDPDPAPAAPAPVAAAPTAAAAAAIPVSVPQAESGVSASLAAAPSGVTVTPAAAEAGPSDLVGKGNRLLASGDLVAARSFFERAFTLGAADGALGAGKTYDPTVYASLKVQGLAPDPVRAMEWYMRAAAAGQAEANAAIATLKSGSQ
jgi:hypothetical protein